MFSHQDLVADCLVQTQAQTDEQVFVRYRNVCKTRRKHPVERVVFDVLLQRLTKDGRALLDDGLYREAGMSANRAKEYHGSPQVDITASCGGRGGLFHALRMIQDGCDVRTSTAYGSVRKNWSESMRRVA